MVVLGLQSANVRRVFETAPRRCVVAAAISAALLAACGGGGGGSDPGQVTTPEAPASGDNGGTGTGGTSAGSGSAIATPLVSNAESFVFTASPGLAQAGALDAFGGALVAGWDVDDAQRMMTPGMKVVFYGAAAGCASGTSNGPVTAGAAATRSIAMARTGLAAAAAPQSWSPSVPAGCTPTTAATSGGAYAAVDATTDGGIALYTPTGPDDAGNAQFFQPFGAGGQNGAGDNAFITGTFVSFRQDWSSANPLQPWAGRGDGSATDARLRSTQSVATAAVGADAGAATPVQVKQQMMATFINTACTKQGATTPMHPCQIQYLLNTSIVRTGVSDWSTVVWYQNGGILFDPVQGGMPVVEGPIGASGATTVDGQTGLPLFTSQGSATQHGTFASTAFDVKVSFAQLQAVIKAIVARKNGVAVSAVGDADISAMWGSQYADPTAWALVSTDIAQEAYNPLAATHAAAIGGVVKDLFVGPQF